MDADQRTNVPHVFAVGDVTDRINLTPVAVDEGRAFADSQFGDQPRRTNHNLVASAVFTQPELATVGCAEEKARQLHGEAIAVHQARFRSLERALPKTGSPCLLKLVLDRRDQRVLGCHMVGNTVPKSSRWRPLPWVWEPARPISIAPWPCIPASAKSS